MSSPEPPSGRRRAAQTERKSLLVRLIRPDTKGSAIRPAVVWKVLKSTSSC